MVWVVLVILVSIVVIWAIPASRGISRMLGEIKPDLDYLLSVDLEQAFLSIRPRFSRNTFIQYSRYQSEDGSLGIELVFPKARWSEDYFPKVVTAATSVQLPYDIQRADDSDIEYVYVKFGQSTQRAAEFGRSVMTNILGYDDKYRFRVRIN